MSGSTRRKVYPYVTAFFGILFATLTIYAAWDLGKDRGAINRDQEIKSAHNPAEANDQIKKRCFVGNQPIESTVNCIKTESEPYQKNSREQQDLDAQKQMALWAKGMFVATLGTLAVTGLGVFLVGLTLRHTRRAADYAKDMVDEARETTKAAWETVSSDRAWMLFGEFRNEQHTDLEFHGKRFRDAIFVYIDWLNCGRSPAIDVRTFSNIVIQSDHLPIPIFDCGDVPSESLMRTIIGPGRFGAGPPQAIGDQFLIALKERRVRVFIYNSIHYRTIYDINDRISENCTEIIYKGRIISPDQSSETDAWIYRAVGIQNTAT